MPFSLRSFKDSVRKFFDLIINFLLPHKVRDIDSAFFPPWDGYFLLSTYLQLELTIHPNNWSHLWEIFFWLDHLRSHDIPQIGARISSASLYKGLGKQKTYNLEKTVFSEIVLTIWISSCRRIKIVPQLWPCMKRLSPISQDFLMHSYVHVLLKLLQCFCF